MIAQPVLAEEARQAPREQHARLALVVGNVPGVLDELRQVELVEAEAADFGDELLCTESVLETRRVIWGRRREGGRGKGVTHVKYDTVNRHCCGSDE